MKYTISQELYILYFFYSHEPEFYESLGSEAIIILNCDVLINTSSFPIKALSFNIRICPKHQDTRISLLLLILRNENYRDSYFGYKPSSHDRYILF